MLTSVNIFRIFTNYIQMGKEDHLSFRRCITNPLMLCMSDKLNAMKMYPLSQRNAMIALLLGMFIAFAGCSKDPVVSPAEEQDDTDFKSSIVLTDEEIASLMFMVEEEKLAMDVYNYLYTLYPVKIFEKIGLSESKHVAAVSKLIEKFELENPIEGNGPGVFVNGDLQQMYYDLQALGEESKIGALTAGVIIEETDIEDIQGYLDEVVQAKPLQQVYEHLLLGSYKHLDSFNHELE